MDSSDAPVLRLFPGQGGPTASTSLRGLYLEPSLRPAGTPSRPFVYASFVASLDGRISLPDPETMTRKVPKAIANPRDWRLFQELAASADVLVTSGRYLRDLAAGVAQDSLPIGAAFPDLLEWRRAHNLPAQPAVAVVTASLDAPLPAHLLQSGRPVYLATGAGVDRARVDALRASGVRVLTAGAGRRVVGRELVTALAAEGFARIDMVAGADLLNTLLADDVLDRLYLTQVCRVLGGVSFETVLKGGVLDPPASFTLRSLCYDDHGVAQLFGVYDRLRDRDVKTTPSHRSPG